MFNRSPMGKYHILVCGTTPCMLCGARTLSAAIKEHLSIDYGQTTPVSQGSAALHKLRPCVHSARFRIHVRAEGRRAERPALLSSAYKLQAAIQVHLSN